MTNQSKTELKRRTLLAGIGGLGVAGIGYGQLRTANRHRTYTHYTYAQPDGAARENGRGPIAINDDEGPRIRVSWYSTYNGHLLTGSPTTTANSEETWDYANEEGYVADVDGPVIHVDNVLPGDSGTASIGLLTEEADARIWLRISASCDANDGEDGCPPLAENPLANAIETELWYDTGIFGLFGCQGAEEGSFGEPIAEGVLAEMPTANGVDGSVSEGLELNPGVLNNSVLEEGDRLCLALAWAFPTDVPNVNDLQGAAVSFDVEFRAVAADDPTNPFAVDTEVTA